MKSTMQLLPVTFPLNPGFRIKLQDSLKLRIWNSIPVDDKRGNSCPSQAELMPAARRGGFNLRIPVCTLILVIWESGDNSAHPAIVFQVKLQLQFNSVGIILAIISKSLESSYESNPNCFNDSKKAGKKCTCQ